MDVPLPWADCKSVYYLQIVLPSLIVPIRSTWKSVSYPPVWYLKVGILPSISFPKNVAAGLFRSILYVGILPSSSWSSLSSLYSFGRSFCITVSSYLFSFPILWGSMLGRLFFLVSLSSVGGVESIFVTKSCKGFFQAIPCHKRQTLLQVIIFLAKVLKKDSFREIFVTKVKLLCKWFLFLEHFQEEILSGKFLDNYFQGFPSFFY